MWIYQTSRTKAPPEGFDEIEDVLEGYNRDMRDGVSPQTNPRQQHGRELINNFGIALAAENEDSEGKRKTESLWPIMRIVHTRSRYIYDLYYEREAISRELYDWLLKQGYADAGYAFTFLIWCSNGTAGLSGREQVDCQVEEARL